MTSHHVKKNKLVRVTTVFLALSVISLTGLILAMLGRYFKDSVTFEVNSNAICEQVDPLNPSDVNSGLTPLMNSILETTTKSSYLAEIGERLSGAIRIPTISYDDLRNLPSDDPSGEKKREPLLTFHTYLKQKYPKIHEAFERKVINKYSLLYEWKGKNEALKPIVFFAHLDVVPVASEKDWKYPPFSGTIANGTVWGRGAADMKGHLISLFDTFELLLTLNYQTDRTIYIVNGHDEELSGFQGARKVAEYLLNEKSLKDRVLFIADEGSSLSFQTDRNGQEMIFASVAVAEKGIFILKSYSISFFFSLFPLSTSC